MVCTKLLTSWTEHHFIQASQHFLAYPVGTGTVESQMKLISIPLAKLMLIEVEGPVLKSVDFQQINILKKQN